MYIIENIKLNLIKFLKILFKLKKKFLTNQMCLKLVILVNIIKNKFHKLVLILKLFLNKLLNFKTMPGVKNK